MKPKRLACLNLSMHFKHEDSFWGGIIKALGLVFGDIGTSPIYTLTIVFAMTKPTVANVYGICRWCSGP
jgi:KUP system potassium uptake protein